MGGDEREQLQQDAAGADRDVAATVTRPDGARRPGGPSGQQLEQR